MKTNSLSVKDSIAPTVAEPKLSLVEKALPLNVLICMIAGLLLGTFAPGIAEHLEIGIPIGLFAMIYPVMVRIRFEDLRKAFLSPRQLAVVAIFNYGINPFTLYLLSIIFLRNQPEIQAGLILLGIAPCIAMVLVWNMLSKGNNALAIVLVAFNSIIQTLTIPLYILLLLGASMQVPIDLIATSVFLYLGLPLSLGYLTRRTLVNRKGEPWYEERFLHYMQPVALIGLLFTLVVMFSLKGDVILQNPMMVALMATPLVIFFFLKYFLILFIGYKLKFNYGDAVAVAYNATGRNFEIAIAIALTAFSATTAVATVIGPLIEVPLMLSLVYITLWLRKRVWKIETKQIYKMAEPSIDSATPSER
ncbi:MAG: ACR3 family arsenite efflux transporter [Candidatus Hodarchaeota archaeon]